MEIENVYTMFHGDVHCNIYAQKLFNDDQSMKKKDTDSRIMPSKTFSCMPKKAIAEIFFLFSFTPFLLLGEFILCYKIIHGLTEYIPMVVASFFAFVVYAYIVYRRTKNNCYGAYLTISPKYGYINSSKGHVKFDDIRRIEYLAEDKTHRTIKVYTWHDVNPKVFPMPTRHDAKYIYDAIINAVPTLKN